MLIRKVVNNNKRVINRRKIIRKSPKKLLVLYLLKSQPLYSQKIREDQTLLLTKLKIKLLNKSTKIVEASKMLVNKLERKNSSQLLKRENLISLILKLFKRKLLMSLKMREFPKSKIKRNLIKTMVEKIISLTRNKESKIKIIKDSQRTRKLKSEE